MSDDEYIISKARPRSRSRSSSSDGNTSMTSSTDDEDNPTLESKDENGEKSNVYFKRVKSGPINLVAPLSAEQLQKHYRTTKHVCRLSDVPTSKRITGQDTCFPGRPARLPVYKVKLHYVIHYILRGTWDCIVPVEGERQGQIEYYDCKACTNKRFRNNIEKNQFSGRGSVLCHIATDHGRLLDAMLNDNLVDMSEEVVSLAKYDRQFNETYRVFCEMNDNSFGLPNSSIVETKLKDTLGVSAKNKYQTATKPAAVSEIKSNTNASKYFDPSKWAEILAREAPKILMCPFCNDYAGAKDGKSFRLHFFRHYKDKWSERIKQLDVAKGVYFCDRCPNRKPNRGATPEGAKSSAICHLAIQHDELRQFVEEDDRLSTSFIEDIFFDQDYHRALKIKSELTNNNNSGKTEQVSEKLPDVTETGKKDELNGSLKRTEAKNKEMSFSPIAKKPYIRKRKKIDFTEADLLADVSDEDWDEATGRSSSTSKKNNYRRPSSGLFEASPTTVKSRLMPKRNASKKVFQTSDDDSDDCFV